MFVHNLFDAKSFMTDSIYTCWECSEATHIYNLFFPSSTLDPIYHFEFFGISKASLMYFPTFRRLLQRSFRHMNYPCPNEQPGLTANGPFSVVFCPRIRIFGERGRDGPGMWDTG